MHTPSPRPRRTLRHLFLLTLIAQSAACAFDYGALSDLECDEEGERRGERICRDGLWVADGSTGPMIDATADLPVVPEDMAPDLPVVRDMARDQDEVDLPAPVDQGVDMPPADQGVDMMMCQPPDAAQACQQDGRKVCEREVMAADSCGMAASVACGDCGSDMLRCQDNVCVPTSCPATTQAYCQTLVAMNADFCGEVDTMRIEGCPLPAPSFTCDTCTGPRQTCQNNACVCSPLDATADRAQLCSSVNNGMSCGQVSVADGCGGMISLSDCATCDVSSYCNTSNACTPRVATALPSPAGLGAAARFGTSIAIDGDRMAIGAPEDTNGNPNGLVCGAVYLYKLQGNGWVFDKRINIVNSGVSYCNNANGDQEEFGYSVALKDDLLVVGAPGDGFGGRAFFYARNPMADDWDQVLVLEGSANERLGESVATTKDTNGHLLTLMGAPRYNKGASNNDRDSGRVHTVDYDPGANTFALSQIYAPSQQGGAHYGEVVRFWDQPGARFLVGEHNRNIDSKETGAYYESTALNNGGTQTAINALNAGVASDGNDDFGQALSQSGTRIAIGAPGYPSAMLSDSGRVFVKEGSGRPSVSFGASNAGVDDNFGESVAILGDLLLAGAPFEDGAGDAHSDTGAVYLYMASANVWMERGLWRVPNQTNDALAGSAVALHPSWGVFSAPREAEGRVYLFQIPIK